MSLAKVRTILEAIRALAPHFNDDEIRELGAIICKTITRLEFNTKGEDK